MAVKTANQKDVALPRLRLRKAHRKSRNGCRNCKLRRVKCDEVQPACRRCSAYGVLCNYGSDAPDLQMAREMEDPAVISADATTTLELTREGRDHLISFEKSGTLLTIATVHHKELLQLACLNPYLMHVVLAIAATHNRLRGTPTPRGPSTFESYHVSQCAALLSRKLSQPLQPEDRDPLWMTSTLLGIISTSSIPSLTPQEVWPLKSSYTSDLEWLRMAEGKMAVWRLADPLRPNGLFRDMADEYAQMYDSPLCTEIDRVPLALARICGITPSSSPNTNPYFTAVHTLAPVLGEYPGQPSRARILSFTSRMDRPFKSLLHARDPVALLLLSLWYIKAGDVVWWLRLRARVEYQSICIYLRRYHADRWDILDLLSCGVKQSAALHDILSPSQPRSSCSFPSISTPV
ncbi:hypothetical protein ABOM_001980 [Aspergillus bombycis]|uniref:Zn(2)-C6 fungal-type domain-containing protein n=1 Tax=Aspergillus bombycis TaxID=109264 RepID=A0A1F8AB54_9EURO|nr:hypothetical protein ABOM_001980 [Aspergillus bombycis]OGM48675.1 hypothetical protein ABOM_001980 [Aspergillus bombycis]